MQKAIQKIKDQLVKISTNADVDDVNLLQLARKAWYFKSASLQEITKFLENYNEESNLDPPAAYEEPQSSPDSETTLSLERRRAILDKLNAGVERMLLLQSYVLSTQKEEKGWRQELERLTNSLKAAGRTLVQDLQKDEQGILDKINSLENQLQRQIESITKASTIKIDDVQEPLEVESYAEQVTESTPVSGVVVSLRCMSVDTDVIATKEFRVDLSWTLAAFRKNLDLQSGVGFDFVDNDGIRVAEAEERDVTLSECVTSENVLHYEIRMAAYRG